MEKTIIKEVETIEPTPTLTSVIDVGLKCNVDCTFCYYRPNEENLRKETFLSSEALKKEIDEAYQRGNKYIEFTGGEPTIHPHICELVEYALKEYGMKSSVITNALIPEKRIDAIVNAGLFQFLVSAQGNEKSHDEGVQVPGGRQKQIRFLNHIKDLPVRLRMNCVINKLNQHDLIEVADFVIEWEAEIMNFINFNPHGPWGNSLANAKRQIADLDVVEEQLNEALDRLEAANIGVNLRYYPMCRLAERHRKTVCNDLHVMYDPYEWDYRVMPKTLARYNRYAQSLSFAIENKTGACSQCSLLFICGGINKKFLEISDDPKKTIKAVKKELSLSDRTDFYHYRKYNVLTLKKDW
jgi:MoaA/NifB/PqqE/SkfB family radical SAM enzyme